MTPRGRTSLLVVAVAVSSAAWGVYTTAQAGVVPFPWTLALVALVPHAGAVAAAALSLRSSAWWRRAALTYMAAFTALEAVGLAQIVPFASPYQAVPLVWSVATSSLALVTALLAVAALRQGHAERDCAAPSPLRWAAVVAGLLLVASSMFAWTASSAAPTGRWIFVLGHASPGVLVGSLIGMAVVVGITAVVAASSERSLVVGATAGLLASHPLALSIFADRTWQDANAILAAGWWIALVAQLLLAAVLVAFLARGADRSHLTRDLAPTV